MILPGPARVDDPLDAVARLSALRDAIAIRARDCGRAPDSVKLVAVSKTFSADDVWPTIAIGGQTRFGENRVQEATPKWRDLRARAAGIGKTIELHLIGPLQSNKAREAVETFDVIETVDREKIAAALAHGNPEDTASRRGSSSRSTPAPSRRKRACCRRRPTPFWRFAASAYGLTIEGLMAIPPAANRPRRISPCSASSPGATALRELSMGMSADWPLAVQLGATYVRIGSAIFGARHATRSRRPRRASDIM